MKVQIMLDGHVYCDVHCVGTKLYIVLLISTCLGWSMFLTGFTFPVATCVLSFSRTFFMFAYVPGIAQRNAFAHLRHPQDLNPPFIPKGNAVPTNRYQCVCCTVCCLCSAACGHFGFLASIRARSSIVLACTESARYQHGTRPRASFLRSKIVLMAWKRASISLDRVSQERAPPVPHTVA